MTATRLSQHRADAMDYYLGDMAKDQIQMDRLTRT
jgi:hypothetical protein